MKKIFKTLVMCISLLLIALAIAGCGGDKFEGKWYSKHVIGNNDYLVDCFVISKNGDGYIVESKKIGFDLAETRSDKFDGKPVQIKQLSMIPSGWGGKDNTTTYTPKIRFYTLEGYWGKTVAPGKVACKAEGNALNLPMLGQLIYNEKKGVLMYGQEELVKMTDAEVKKLVQDAIKKDFPIGKQERERVFDEFKPAYKSCLKIVFYEQNGKEIESVKFKDIPEAISDFINEQTAKIEKNSKDKLALDKRGCAYGYVDKYKEAIDDLTKCLELSSSSRSEAAYRRAIGSCLREMKEYDKAIDSYNKAIDAATKFNAEKNGNHIKPSFWNELYNGRGYTYTRMKKYNEAIADCDKALKFTPNEYNTMDTKAEALFEAKKYNEALAIYNIISAKTQDVSLRARANAYARACTEAMAGKK